MRRSPEGTLMLRSGIYAIVHVDSGKCYVGSAVNLGARWRKHLDPLRKGKHGNSRLQRAWAKYGEERFRFVVLEACARDDLVRREQHWMNLLAPEYNICLTAGSTLGHKPTPETRAKMSEAHTGYKHTPETLAKMSVAQTGHKRNTLEMRARLSVAKRGKNLGRKMSSEMRAKLLAANRSRKGHKHTLATRAKMSVAKMGHKRNTPEMRAKLSAAVIGRKMSPETRAKISAAMMGNRHAAGRKFVVPK